MAAASLDILVEQGATFSRVLTIKDSSGNPINITGWTFAGEIRATAPSGTILANFAFSIINAALGQVSWTLDATTSAGIAVLPAPSYIRLISNYTYDINATHLDGTVERLLQGTCQVSPEVTR
jgi:hypothetical protein